MNTTAEKDILQTSRAFWNAMEHADEKGMREYADPACQFVHIGTNADLNKEIAYYTSGAFQPTNITFHNQEVKLFGDTAIMLSDVDYGLLLNGEETSHHFMVTEVYKKEENAWKLIQFSFTALVY